MNDRAMPCPACGGASRVLDSRPTPDQGHRRRRRCAKCGERFTTYEICGAPTSITLDVTVHTVLKAGHVHLELRPRIARLEGDPCDR
jgi:hypothetical protein